MVPILSYRSWMIGGSSHVGDHHQALARDLETLFALGLTIVSLDQIVEAHSISALDDLAGCVGLAFDDGCRLDYDDLSTESGRRIPSFLNILRESSDGNAIHATAFVPSDGEWDGSDGIEQPNIQPYGGVQWWGRAVKTGYMQIGCRGTAALSAQSVNAALAEHHIHSARESIDSMLGGPFCHLFAYPGGLANQWLRDEYFPYRFADHRMLAAFTLEPRPVSNGEDRWSMPRFTCGRDWQNSEELRQLLCDARPRTSAMYSRQSAGPEAHSNGSEQKKVDSMNAISNGQSYSAAWDTRAHSEQAARAAVDGSASEESLRVTGAWSARQVKAALDIQPNHHVFELGCGVARIGYELMPSCAHWSGADISANMLTVARQRLAEYQHFNLYHLTRTQLLGMADNSIDRAYCVAVFCHMDKEDFFLYLNELQRVLKPGGRVYFENWNVAHPIGWKRFQFEVRHWQHSVQNERKDVARNQFSVPEEVKVFAAQAGFEIAACYHDSPWVQTIAIKQPTDTQMTEARSHIEKNRSVIENNELFSECFSKQLDLIYGAIDPRELMTWFKQQDQNDVIELYRAYTLETWRQNTRRWGAVDT